MTGARTVLRAALAKWNTFFFAPVDLRYLAAFRALYGALAALNLGVSGDRTQNVLWRLENGLLDNVAARGAQLREGLLALQREFPRVREVRGRGLIVGLRVDGAAELQKQLYANGLVTNCTAGDVIRLLPPYVIRSQDVDEALAILRTTLRAAPTPTPA